MDRGYRKKQKQLGTIIDYSVPELKSYKKYVNNTNDFPVARNYSKHIINFQFIKMKKLILVVGSDKIGTEAIYKIEN